MIRPEKSTLKMRCVRAIICSGDPGGGHFAFCLPRYVLPLGMSYCFIISVEACIRRFHVTRNRAIKSWTRVVRAFDRGSNIFVNPNCFSGP